MSNAGEQVAALLEQGYVEVQEYGALKVGGRVHHVSQRWPEARERGTGTIERIFHHRESAWQVKYRRADVELIVRRDEPMFGPDDTHQFVADYHVHVVA